MTKHSNLFRFLLPLTALLALTLSVAGGTRRVAAPAPAAKQAFGPMEKEAFLPQDAISYIRPGLKIIVNSVTIGGNRIPVVDVSMTDGLDQPLDRLGKVTPGPIAISFILAWYDPATRHYTSYTTRSVTTPASSPHPGVTVLQAGTDTGSFVDLEMGHAKFTFKTVLPAGFDQTKTTTLGIYATRAMVTDVLSKNYYANVEYDFRPDGGTVTDVWDKVREATSCNNCHDPISAHGGARQQVKLCVLCHQPQTIDPDTGNTVDFKVMIHKIHDGASLPSVKAGTPYQIIGFGQAVNDWSTVVLPQDIRNCTVCHAGSVVANVPKQTNVWYSNPSAAACSSCHDDVNFATGANHPGGKQADDSGCAACHQPESGVEFDASIKGAHTVPYKSKQLPGFTASIVSVTNAAPGKSPTVVYSIKNGDGTAIDGTKLTTFSPILAGPNTNYTKDYRREDARTLGTFNAAAGTTSYTFVKPIPTDATGSWTVSADMRRTVNLKRGDGGADIAQREAPVNPVKYVAVTGTTVTPRRVVVADANCFSCHDRLALHGEQRKTTLECVICHNPQNDDNRAASLGAPESISFQRFIHRIHTGENLTQTYTVSNSNFNDVRFPGNTRDCAKCHAGASYTLPLQPGIANVITLRDYFPSQGPATAACLGCHDNSDAAAHAYLNTVTFPGATTSNEACATCHGTGKDWSVEKEHAQ
jgi:OmcA/MtrC family decaheme c-type cytochrome